MPYSTETLRENAINCYLDNVSINEIAKMHYVNRATIYRWVARYNKKSTVKRKSSPGSGRPTRLNNLEIAKLSRIIAKPASKYGFETDFWTTRRIIQIAKSKLNIVISKTTMCDMLYSEGMSYKSPAKRYYEANLNEQKTWVSEVLPRIKRIIKEKKAILYFEDEANVSLSAVLGKTWGPIGVKTIQQTTGGKGSISAMSAISGTGRLIFTLHDTKIRSQEVIMFLMQMMEHHPRRHLIVIMDQAKPHIAKQTQEFMQSQNKLDIIYLPKRSPHLNPDEQVWHHLKHEELKSHTAKNTYQLKNLAKRKLLKISRRPYLLRSLFQRSEIYEFL